MPVTKGTLHMCEQCVPGSLSSSSSSTQEPGNEAKVILLDLKIKWKETVARVVPSPSHFPVLK